MGWEASMLDQQSDHGDAIANFVGIAVKQLVKVFFAHLIVDDMLFQSIKCLPPLFDSNFLLPFI